MDGAYLVILFVTTEQELSIRTLFKESGWQYRGIEFSSCTIKSVKDAFPSATTGLETSLWNPGAGDIYKDFVTLFKEFLVSHECSQSNVSFSTNDKFNKKDNNKIPTVSSAKLLKSSGSKKLKARAKSKRCSTTNRSKGKLEKNHKQKYSSTEVSSVLHNSKANQKQKGTAKLIKSLAFDVQIEIEKERGQENSEETKMEPLSLEQSGAGLNDTQTKSREDNCHGAFVSDTDFTGIPCIQASNLHIKKNGLSALLKNCNEDEVFQSSIKTHSKEEKSKRGKINKQASTFINSINISDLVQDDIEVESDSLNIDSKQKLNVSYISQASKLSRKGKYDCTECGGTFTFLSKYQNHKRDGKCKFECSFCGKNFTSRNWSTYQAHLRWHKNERPFQCNQCDKSYKFVTNLNDHKRTHSGERPFICDFCGSSFTKSLLMRAHIKRKHLEQKRLHCDQCDSLFSNDADLKQHLKYTHSTARPFECHICHKTYKTKPTLNIHLLTHNEERGFTCDICNKSFKLRGTLRCHMIRHKKQYSVYCDICGKGCYDNKKLREHKRTHSGEKPFACSVCNYRCAIAGNLKKHMKVHEKGTLTITSKFTQHTSLNGVVCTTYMSKTDSNIPGSRKQTQFTTPQCADSRHLFIERSDDILNDRTKVIKSSQTGYKNAHIKVCSSGTELQSPELQKLSENVKTFNYNLLNADVGNFTQIHENGVTYIHDAETGVTYAHVTNQDAKLGQVLSDVRNFHAKIEEAEFTNQPMVSENYEQTIATQYDHFANQIYQAF